MTRKSRIYKAENQPFIVKRICLYLGYIDQGVAEGTCSQVLQSTSVDL